MGSYPHHSYDKLQLPYAIIRRTPYPNIYTYGLPLARIVSGLLRMRYNLFNILLHLIFYHGFRVSFYVIFA